MATREEMLGGIEAVEYLKEAARQIAAGLVADADATEVVANPSGFVDDVMAALMDQLGPLVKRAMSEAEAYAELLGFEAADELDYEAAAEQEKNRFILLLRPALMAAALPISADLASHMARGVASETLARAMTVGDLSAVLLRDFTATLRGEAADLMTRMHLGVVEAAAETLAQDEPAELLTWITVHSVCDDETVEGSCLPRHGLEKTYEDWSKLGHPWVPNRICRERCRCAYMRGPDAALHVSPVSAREAVKSGKSRAVADFGPKSA